MSSPVARDRARRSTAPPAHRPWSAADGGSTPSRPLREMSDVDIPTPTTGLVVPEDICWLCFGRSGTRLRKAYTALYEHGQGQAVLVNSCRTLARLLGMGHGRVTDVLLGLEAAGLAQVELGAPGLDENAEASRFTLTRPRTPPVCKAEHGVGSLTLLSLTQSSGGDLVPEPREERTTVPVCKA